MLKLFRYFEDVGRMGSLEGLFIASQEAVDSIIGQGVYFGEILGKHSEIISDLPASAFEVVSEDQEKIAWLKSILGASVSGINPFDYELLEEEN